MNKGRISELRKYLIDNQAALELSKFIQSNFRFGIDEVKPVKKSTLEPVNPGSLDETCLLVEYHSHSRFPLDSVESELPRDVPKAWERNRLGKKYKYPVFYEAINPDTRGFSRF